MGLILNINLSTKWQNVFDVKFDRIDENGQIDDNGPKQDPKIE